MRKILIFTISLSLVFLTGCNSNKNEQTPAETKEQTKVAEDTIDWVERDKENTKRILEKLQ